MAIPTSNKTNLSILWFTAKPQMSHLLDNKLSGLNKIRREEKQDLSWYSTTNPDLVIVTHNVPKRDGSRHLGQAQRFPQNSAPPKGQDNPYIPTRGRKIIHTYRAKKTNSVQTYGEQIEFRYVIKPRLDIKTDPVLGTFEYLQLLLHAEDEFHWQHYHPLPSLGGFSLTKKRTNQKGRREQKTESGKASTQS